MLSIKFQIRNCDKNSLVLTQ